MPSSFACSGICFSTSGVLTNPGQITTAYGAAALRRALWARDKGCSFFGCTHTCFVDAHHIRHWAKGGKTSLGNTMLLCSAHHRLVHEGSNEIRSDDRGRWYFKRPDGRTIPAYGYQPEDMVDEGIHDNTAPFARGAFAEAPES